MVCIYIMHLAFEKAASVKTLLQFGPEELEVHVFEQQQQTPEQHAAGQQNEGTREVEDAERHRTLACLGRLCARAGQPEPLQAFQLSCE